MKRTIFTGFIVFITILFMACEVSDTSTDPTNKILVGNYTITNEEELQAMSGYSELEGSLTISSNSLGNLNGLESLTLITGNLNIENNSFLSNIHGLDNIVEIGGDLIISQNQNNIFSIVENDVFYKLKSVGERFIISYNETIDNINMFDSLETVGDYMLIEHNPGVNQIRGFTSLISCRDLIIRINVALGYTNGFTNLITVNGNFKIESNPLMGIIRGFESLTNITGNFSIKNNVKLTTFYNLDTISNFTGSVFTISDNDILKACDAERIRDYILLPNYTDWSNIVGNTLSLVNNEGIGTCE